MSNQPSKMVMGAPYKVQQYHKHVSLIDSRGYAVAVIGFGEGHSGMPDVHRALDFACSIRDRINEPDTAHDWHPIEQECSICGTPRTQPPIDNAHVAPGCEQFGFETTLKDST